MGSGKTSLIYFRPNITNKLEQRNILCPENIISYYSKENEKYFLKTTKLDDNPKIYLSSNPEIFKFQLRNISGFQQTQYFLRLEINTQLEDLENQAQNNWGSVSLH